MGANKIVTNTCKIGQGHDCCRYLMAGRDGFECAKQTVGMKVALDLRVDLCTIIARGDNCDGYSTIESIIPLNKEDDD